MLPSDATSIHSITEWPSLSQSSSIRTADSFPYGAPARMGNDTDLPCSVRRTRWVSPCYVVPTASDPTVTRRAWISRLPLTEQRALSPRCFAGEAILRATSCRTYTY
ncbi:unnamed protein product, partial [Enterobius vermicularis]|uniref:Uncharacterized protein n=1 Tax=Enterobius vermicularis TaxID=51028 RepID=A0A0N4UTV9_ENTVE